MSNDLSTHKGVTPMSILKDYFQEALENIHAEAEENNQPITDTQAAELANQRAIDRLATMIDNAKDAAKYQ